MKAIRAHDRLLLILSEDSMNSEWVKTEIANAREKERREGRSCPGFMTGQIRWAGLGVARLSNWATP